MNILLYFNIKDKRHYDKLDKDIETCLNFIENENLILLKNGQHKLTNNISYNVLSFKTASSKEREWEAHKDFIDIQTIIEGKEKVDYQHLSKMEIGEYQADTDFLQVNGEPNFSVKMEKDSILILYPEDAHKTGIDIEKSKEIRKVVFKVKVAE